MPTGLNKAPKSDFWIYALGKKFDVKKYKKKTIIPFDIIWILGQGHYESSGIGKELGNGLRLNITRQEDVAHKFMTKYADELRELSEYPGVTHCNVGIQIMRLDLPPSTTCFTVTPSPRLMWHSLNIRFQLTYYVRIAQ